VFLSNEELESIAIDQSVFHIVGPRESDFHLLEAFDATQFSRFFIGRVKSVNSGNRYCFLPDASVRTQLRRIAADPKSFQDESENLARAFDLGHRGSSAVGAFLIFSLRTVAGQVFALMKFEDEKVLSYDFKQGPQGKFVPTFGEINRTFVQNRNALQKAALIRFVGDNDEVCVVDRQNPQRPAAYFEQFLGVRRLRTEVELTKKLYTIMRSVAAKHREEISPNTMGTLGRRLYEATQTGADIDGERIDDWVANVLGPLPNDSPVFLSVRGELKKERMIGECFKLEGSAVPAPRNRKIETRGGVKVIFPVSTAASVVRVDESNGIITIQDKIIENDFEFENSHKASS
jgi:hypothetical protein